MTTLRINNINYELNKVILSDFSFTSDSDRIISIVGRSGCGKTTLLNLISGLIKANSGTIKIDDTYISEPSRKVSYLPQKPVLLPYLTALENIKMGFELRNISPNEKLNEILNKFDLLRDKNKFPDELSGGMKQRVGLIQTLLINASLYLLDEPFSALDRNISDSIESFIWKKIKNSDSSLLNVTHDLDRALSISDTIIMMESNPGKINSVHSLNEEFKSKSPLERRKSDNYPVYLLDLIKKFSDL